ncbi:MAG: transcription elongation factor GreB [Geminicoccaceae bacterium]
MADNDDDGPAPLPADAEAYLTPAGAARFQAELHELRAVERPKVVEVVSWAAGNGDRSENGDYIYGKKRLREIDRRMRFLIKRLEKAKIVDPAVQTLRDRVFFGAIVTYADEDERERTVTIVGVDEARLDQGEISLVSPVARALLRAGIGDWRMVRKPGGEEEVEVRAITYPDPP